MQGTWQELGGAKHGQHFFPGNAGLSAACVWQDTNGAWNWELLQNENGPWQQEPSKMLAHAAAVSALGTAQARRREAAEERHASESLERVRAHPGCFAERLREGEKILTIAAKSVIEERDLYAE